MNVPHADGSEWAKVSWGAQNRDIYIYKMTLKLCPNVTGDRKHFEGRKRNRYKQIKCNLPVPEPLLRRKFKNNLPKSFKICYDTSLARYQQISNIQLLTGSYCRPSDATIVSARSNTSAPTTERKKKNTRVYFMILCFKSYNILL